MKKNMLLALITTTFLTGTLLLAQEENPRPPQGINPEIDNALQECADSLGASATTEPPDMKLMDDCMSAKGFKKPAKHPGNDANSQIRPIKP